METLTKEEVRAWCSEGGMTFHKFDRIGFPVNERVIEMSFPGWNLWAISVDVFIARDLCRARGNVGVSPLD